MPRTARIVVPGVAHHVTQRGNRRQQTFFGASDYARYVDLIGDGCRRSGVDVLAWCLMPNHVHLVLVPPTAESLTAALAVAHRCYTWVVNRRNGWQGHLWQNRYFSSPVDDAHLANVVRYVELNPVRARLVTDPQAWAWSSAPARIGEHGDMLIRHEKPTALRAVGDWSKFLGAGLAHDDIERIRLHQIREIPLGEDAFVRHIEALTGCSLRPRPRGRPRKHDPAPLDGQASLPH